MHYELWHVPSGNIVNTFSREDDALELVRQTYTAHGGDRASEFALGTEDQQGNSAQIATGTELLTRALGREPRRAARS